MLFEIEVGELESARQQLEQYDREELTTQEEIQKWAEETIANFNKTLRPGEKARRLIGVKIIGESVRQHQWHKTNLVTISKGGQMYDAYRCDHCGATGKRFGLDEHVTRDAKYRAQRWENCQPSKEKN